jgi:hypothetical protein
MTEIAAKMAGGNTPPANEVAIEMTAGKASAPHAAAMATLRAVAHLFRFSKNPLNGFLMTAI